jgi:hypothetical protein
MAARPPLIIDGDLCGRSFVFFAGPFFPAIAVLLIVGWRLHRSDDPGNAQRFLLACTRRFGKNGSQGRLKW